MRYTNPRLLYLLYFNTLSSGPHVNLITAKAAVSFYVLKTLKSMHGLSGPALSAARCTGYSSGTDSIIRPMQTLPGEDY